MKVKPGRKVGFKLSNEQKVHLSKMKKGVTFSDAHKANLSKASKGVPKSEAHRATMSANRKGKSFGTGSIEVNGFTYASKSKAIRELGITWYTLHKILNK
jgi:hypothetical protein